MDNIEKFRLESKIRVAFFKHRGDVVRIADELGIDIRYIEKIVCKIKRRKKRDVSYWLATSIMELIHIGFTQRTLRLSNFCNELENERYAEVSMCCSEPVKREQSDSTPKCLKCDKECRTKTVSRAGVITLIDKLHISLREEEKQLADFAVKMGFLGKEELPKPPIVKQDVFVLGGGVDRKIVDGIDELSPMEGERLRKSLETAITEEAKFEDNENKKE